MMFTISALVNFLDATQVPSNWSLGNTTTGLLIEVVNGGESVTIGQRKGGNDNIGMMSEVMCWSQPSIFYFKFYFRENCIIEREHMLPRAEI